MNWWPEAKWLVQIERKFSDSLSYEDVNGEVPIKQPKKTKEEKLPNNSMSLSTLTEAKKE
jgi:hypothetical protein